MHPDHAAARGAGRCRGRCPSRRTNYIGITEPPSEMFGKIMRISDDLMWRYYELVSSRKHRRDRGLQARGWRAAAIRRDFKVLLGQEVVTRFHSPHAAETGAAGFRGTLSARARRPRTCRSSLFSAQGKGGGRGVSAAQAGRTGTPPPARAIRAIAQGGRTHRRPAHRGPHPGG